METIERNVKQVIVYRKDLLKNHRKGKFGAQCCHASLGALLKVFSKTSAVRTNPFSNERVNRFRYELEFDEGTILDKWLNGIFTKICLYVENEEELVELYNKITSERPDIPCVLIEDNGLTEFHGVKTKTCIGIGPYWSDEIDVFTKNLKLL